MKKPTQKMLEYAESLAMDLEEECPWWGRCEEFPGTGISYPVNPTFEEVSKYISDAKIRVSTPEIQNRIFMRKLNDEFSEPNEYGCWN